MTDSNDFQIFRGAVDGQNKYCRVLIRRKRASAQEAIEFFTEVIPAYDVLAQEFEGEELEDLREQQACFVAALVALRAQQEQESNDPLPLDELREMNGEPVWWWNTSAKPVCMICVFDRFMKEPMFANYDFISEDAVNLTKYKWLKKCGYKPYRHKPEEGTR